MKPLQKSILMKQSKFPLSSTLSFILLTLNREVQKNRFPCMYPGLCNGKQNIFNRPADLARHYKNVHCPPEEFACDYPNCPRFKDPFGRKDHYRDHLRDFHKEDIGSAKRGTKDEKHWPRAQKAWLAERIISHRHWRCIRCLVKNYVAEVGWECSSCKTPCEEDRIRARMKAGESAGDMQVPAIAEPIAYYCAGCNGSLWVEDEGGTMVACPRCSTPASSYDEWW
jgi:hypothetical protein